MNEFMVALLGANWRTSAASYLQLVILAIVTYFYEGGTWPISPEGWAAIGYGMMGVVKGHLTKDAAVSNAIKPTKASTVPSLFLVGLLSLTMVGCAGSAVESTVQRDLAALQNFAVADLDTALTGATISNDQIALQCWNTLLGMVRAAKVEPPKIKGVASAIQARRDITNSGSIDTMKNKLILGCSALAVSEGLTIAELLGKAGVGIPPLP